MPVVTSQPTVLNLALEAGGSYAGPWHTFFQTRRIRRFRLPRRSDFDPDIQCALSASRAPPAQED